MSYDYQTLKVQRDGHILNVVIDNPPVNVMTMELYMDLLNFSAEAEKDESVKVIVLDSADPDFFIAHFDVEVLLALPVDGPAERESEPNLFHQMCERMRTMPKATIVKLAGRVGGGGSEFSASCDMRFGITGKTRVNQMEVALGILPGGTGTQRLPRLVGRGRAMEIVLGSDDIDAETAEKWGYLNRVFESREELDKFVDRLAARIAAWPAEAIALAKQSVNNAELPLAEGLVEEAYLFQQTLRTDDARKSMQRAMELGAQTREGELMIGELCLQVAKSLEEDQS